MKPAPHHPLVKNRDRSKDHVSSLNRLIRGGFTAGSVSRLALAGLGITLGGTEAFAFTDTNWTGNASTGWSTAGNWDNGILTTSNSSGSRANFTGNVTARQPNVASSTGIYGILISTPTGGWTISGNSSANLTIGAGGLRTTGQTSGTNTVNSFTLNPNVNQTWSVGTGGNLVINSPITSAANVVLTLGIAGTDEGTMTFNGSSNRDGSTTFRAGTLLLGDDTALGIASSRLSVTGGGTVVALGASGGARTIANSVTINSSLTFVGTQDMTFSSSSFQNNGQTVTVNNGSKIIVSGANGIGGTGGFTVGAGNGTLVISGGTNTNNGTIVLSGKLQLGNGGTAGALNAASAVTLNSTGELSFNRTDSGLTVANVISGAGGIRQSGSGNTTLSGNNSAFTGNTTVAAGTLVVGHANALGGSGGGVVSVSNNATLSTSVGLTFSNNVINSGTINSGGNAVVFTAGKTLTGTGAFAGGGSFSVDGTFTHGLHPGSTTVNSTAMTFGSASTTVWRLASLTDNGTGTAGVDWDTFVLQGAGSVSITSGAGLQIGLDGISFDGSQSYWQTSHSYSLFSASVAGTFALSGNVFSDASGTGTFSVAGNNLVYTFSPAAIPEASTSAFVILAGAAVVFGRTRRRSRAD